MDARTWDDRYAGTDLVWGTEPNQFVAAELASLPPGRALDLACGEGRNAIWLAARGWQVVGVDFSSVAVERARQLAARAGVADRATFVVADAVGEELPPGPFDLVVVAYLQLAAAERRAALRRAASVLGPRGTLLLVAHDSTNLSAGVGGPQDARVLYTAEDVLADLAGTPLTVERAEPVRRRVAVAGEDREAIDTLVRVRRRDA